MLVTLLITCPRLHRAKWDDNARLQDFTEKLEAACIGTVESGKMTKDLALIIHGSKYLLEAISFTAAAHMLIHWSWKLWKKFIYYYYFFHLQSYSRSVSEYGGVHWCSGRGAKIKTVVLIRGGSLSPHIFILKNALKVSFGFTPLGFSCLYISSTHLRKTVWYNIDLFLVLSFWGFDTCNHFLFPLLMMVCSLVQFLIRYNVFCSCILF